MEITRRLDGGGEHRPAFGERGISVEAAMTAEPERDVERQSDRKPVLLTVDDDPGVSRAVARDLRRHYGDSYRVVRTESGPGALEALRELKLRGDRVAVLLADHRMPGMTGIEFLEQAMDLFPSARRALLTAYADTGAAIKAINDVDLDHYLLKPWDPPEEKLYPVVDSLLDAWRAACDVQPVRCTQVVGHRWSAHSFEVRDFLARNSVPYRWVTTEEPEGQQLLSAAGVDDTAIPLVVTPDRRASPRSEHRRAGRPSRAVDDASHRLLRRGHRRWWSGRSGSRRVRRLGGPPHRAGRATGDRRASGAELADRELPRLPGRHQRYPIDQPRPPPGPEVRRRDPHHPRRRRTRRGTIVTGRSLRRRWSGRRPRRAPGDGDLLPQARRPGRRGVDRPRRVLRVGGHGGHGLRGRRGLHRRRRQLGRTGGRLLRPPCPAGHDARAGQHPRGLDVALPRQADRRDPHDRGPARQRGDRCRRRRAPRSTDRSQSSERAPTRR